jgi:ATP-binding cassette subfamily B protein
MILDNNAHSKSSYVYNFLMVFKIFKFLKKIRIFQMFLLFFLTITGVFIEVLSISSLIPLINILVNIEKYLDNSFLLYFIKFFSISSKDSITVFFLLIFIILLFISFIFKLIVVCLNTYVSSGIGHDLNVLVFKNSIKQNLIFYKDNNSNIVLANLQKTEKIRGIFLSILEISVSIIVCTAVIGFMIFLDPEFVFVSSLVIFLLYFIIFISLKKKLLDNSKIESLVIDYKIKLVQETSYIIREIILKKLSKFFLKKFINLDLKIRNIIFKNTLYVNLPGHCVMLVASFLIIIFIYLFSLKEGGLVANIAILGALIMSSQRLLSNLQTIYGSFVFLRSSFYPLHDVYSSINSIAKYNNKKIISKNLNFNNKIKIINGTFKYKNRKNYLFKNINLTFNKGLIYLIWGSSGCGKTTLVDLITGFVQFNSGKIKIDNQILNVGNIDAWQRKISYVSQESTITDNSIIENIALGAEDKEVDLKKIYHVCRMSEVYNDIIKFNNNFSTMLGEHGKRVSGGQKQRIAIARALYTDSDIIILDEATNALDAKTEDKIYNNLKKFYSTKTIIIVSHRKSAKIYADFVISIKNRKIIKKKI